jgi:exosome complex component CSL4
MTIMSKREEGEKRGSVALPGDLLALPEEFLPGKNTYEEEDSIRASLAGRVEKDISKREVSVRPVTVAVKPTVGDVVLGQVEAAMTSTAGVRISYINGKETRAGFPGTIFMRERSGGGRERGGERRTYVKLGDVVRARVTSTLNGMNQLSIDEPHLGVIASMCSVCGAQLMARGDGRAGCDQCGNVEERKFADDFGSANIQP